MVQSPIYQDQSHSFAEFTIEVMMCAVAKFLCISSVLSAVSSVPLISDEGREDWEILQEEFFKAEPRIFEDKILEALNNFKELLKNGDPANGISPLDPYFLARQDFDFIIKDTALKGFFRDVAFANFSRFEVTNIELKLLPLYFKIDIFLDQFRIDGKYKMMGRILDEISVNGTGKFISETQNLTLSLYLRPRQVNSHLQIKDIIFEFKTLREQVILTENDYVNYTNELVSDEFQVLDENLIIYVLDQVQEKYVPPLLNMVKLVLNHFLLGYSFQEVMDIILEFLNKK